MPGTFGQLVRNRRRIDIPLDEEGASVFIDYRPGAITERLRLEFDAANSDDATNDEKLTAITDYLLAVIDRWDITDKGGNIIPLTPDGFRDHVSYEDRLFLMQTIHEDAQMGEANGASASEPSDSTSPPKATQATSRRRSRTGTH